MNNKPAMYYIKIRVCDLDEIVAISKYHKMSPFSIHLGKPGIIPGGYLVEEISEVEYTTLEAFDVPCLKPDKDGKVFLHKVIDPENIVTFKQRFKELEEGRNSI